MRQKIKQTHGITLMALIVTIIVLLILAGISISMLAGNNGILNKAAEAKEKTEIAEMIEEVKLAILDKQMENLGSITSGDLREVLIQYFSDVPVELPEDETELAELELTTIDGKYTIKLGDIWQGSFSDMSDGVATLPSDTGTTPYLPSKDFSQVAGTDLSTGLVIEDKDGNQYVWIEVPRKESVYPTAKTEITPGSDGKFTEEQYTAIEEDLHTYTTTYRTEADFVDEYYSDETTGLAETQYNDLKQTMLQSVYTNGGFWIGRYEAGIATNRASHVAINDSSAIPTSKENEYPYNWVTCSEAQTLASKVNSGNYTSSLMFGVQWDLVLKYLEVKAVEKGTELATIQDELNTNSTSLGNYYSNTYNITNTLAKYSLDSGNEWLNAPYSKESAGTVLLTTGATDTFSKQNIFDLAGNVFEWTLEYTANTSSPCAIRGGKLLKIGQSYWLMRSS